MKHRRQYNAVRSYSVDLNENAAKLIEDYDEQFDTSYLSELIDAATRMCDVGNLTGTMYLLLDGDGEGTRTWYDELGQGLAQSEPLFQCEYEADETDFDYEDA